MGTGSGDREKESYLRAQNEAALDKYNTQIQGWQPSEYEKALNDEGVAWIKATSGDQPLDISKLSGMAPYMDMYRTASADQANERKGLGSMALGASFANPNLTSALKEQFKNKRIQDAGGELESAFSARNAAVRGLAMPLIGVGEGRNESKLNATAGMAGNTLSNFARFQTRPSFWQQLMLASAAGASQAATAAAGGG